MKIFIQKLSWTLVHLDLGQQYVYQILVNSIPITSAILAFYACFLTWIYMYIYAVWVCVSHNLDMNICHSCIPQYRPLPSHHPPTATPFSCRKSMFASWQVIFWPVLPSALFSSLRDHLVSLPVMCHKQIFDVVRLHWKLLRSKRLHTFICER